MKKLLFSLLFACSAALCFGQQNLISYEDIKFLLHNNLAQADTFLTAKGYTTTQKNLKTRNRTYRVNLNGGTFVTLAMRADGKKQYMELETNDLTQYTLINNSISQYINKEGSIGDVQTYFIKNLCSIYITVNDTRPYNPLKRNYVMQIVPDKSITAYD